MERSTEYMERNMETLAEQVKSVQSVMAIRSALATEPSEYQKSEFTEVFGAAKTMRKMELDSDSGVVETPFNSSSWISGKHGKHGNHDKTGAGQLRVAAYFWIPFYSSDSEYSYGAQEAHFLELLSQNPGWKSVGIYADYEYSGNGSEIGNSRGAGRRRSRQKRNSLRRLLIDCQNGKVDRIVSQSLSSFAGTVGELLASLKILRENQVTVLFEREGLDTADPAGERVLTALAAVMTEEVRSVSASFRRGNRRRFQEGQARNYCIYGYRYVDEDGAVSPDRCGYPGNEKGKVKKPDRCEHLENEKVEANQLDRCEYREDEKGKLNQPDRCECREDEKRKVNQPDRCECREDKKVEIKQPICGFRKIEIVEEEAAVVRRIFHAVDDGMAYVDVARMLNQEGIPAPRNCSGRKAGGTRTGGNVADIGGVNSDGRAASAEGQEIGRATRLGGESVWTPEMISRMVGLERYCGDALLQKTYTPDPLAHESRKNKGKVSQYLIRDHHPAIIDRELFERVQTVREYNAGKFANKSSERNPWAFSGRLICGECGRSFHVRNIYSHPIWFCPGTEKNNGMIGTESISGCHAEKVYEEQIRRMLREAAAERFVLTEEQTGVEQIGVERIGVEHVREQLEAFQRSDDLERRWRELQEQMVVLEAEIAEMENSTDYVATQPNAPRNTLETESEERNDLQTQLEERDVLKRKLEDRDALETQIKSLEEYRERVAADYGERERALAWIKTLPEGPEGTALFLDGVAGEYVRAFVLTITVRDPLHYTVRWFDNTETEVEMQSNVEDYRRGRN